MKQLEVSFQDDLTGNSAIADVEMRLQTLDKQQLSYAPWTAYPYMPSVEFAMTYGHDALFLQFLVAENRLQAAYGGANDPVYKDSCVEFFIALTDDTAYYNFECNCIGSVLGGFGAEKSGRRSLSPGVLETIGRKVVVNRGGKLAQPQWCLTLVIPFGAFAFHSLSSLRGQRCRANFYKCGDDLPTPHFLAWSDIKSEEPNFHLPAFFGELQFA